MIEAIKHLVDTRGARHKETHLKVQVVDGRKGAEAVVPEPEGGVVNLCCESQGQEES